MGLEAASFISGLDSANPTATDPKSQGDDHLRLIKAVLKATLPNANAAINPTPTEFNTLVGTTGAVAFTPLAGVAVGGGITKLTTKYYHVAMQLTNNTGGGLSGLGNVSLGSFAGTLAHAYEYLICAVYPTTVYDYAMLLAQQNGGNVDLKLNLGSSGSFINWPNTSLLMVNGILVMA